MGEHATLRSVSASSKRPEGVVDGRLGLLERSPRPRSALGRTRLLEDHERPFVGSEATRSNRPCPWKEPGRSAVRFGGHLEVIGPEHLLADLDRAARVGLNWREAAARVLEPSAGCGGAWRSPGDRARESSSAMTSARR